ncbi:MAG: DUF58 domain-containing protein [Comamonadaceae bacterium]|nr:DUF58 domain-containing protein [Comamonadaceae bacterium]
MTREPHRRAAGGRLAHGAPASGIADADRGRLDLRPPPAAACGRRHLPLAFRVGAGQGAELSYRLHLLQRGRHAVRTGGTAARLAAAAVAGAPFRRRAAVRCGSIPISPRSRSTRCSPLDNRLGQIGLLQRRRRGQGLEFHQLRDYRQDDSPRQIDWKATARHRRLISRDYQDERDQQIVVPPRLRLCACARMDGELSHFDHALNAVLLLAYVALRQGDACRGWPPSRQDTPRFLPPRKSLASAGEYPDTASTMCSPRCEPPDYVAGGSSAWPGSLARALAGAGADQSCARKTTRRCAACTSSSCGSDTSSRWPACGSRCSMPCASTPVREYEEALSYAAARGVPAGAGAAAGGAAQGRRRRAGRGAGGVADGAGESLLGS